MDPSTVDVPCHDVEMTNRPDVDEILAGMGGTRVEWSATPDAVRQSVEDRLGASVSDADGQLFGFSPGLAARLRLADGRRVFVKAIGPDNVSGAPGGQDAYRREARISAGLPLGVAAPRLVESWEASGWVILVLEDVDGVNPSLPWRADQLSRILRALAETAASLTPFWSHPLAAAADRSDVVAVLAAFAGFMIDGATQPPPPGLPNLRQFQLAQGRHAAQWLRQILAP